MFFVLFACISEFSSYLPSSILNVTPKNDSIVSSDDNVLFSIEVSDPDTPMSQLVIRVESDIDGVTFKEAPDDNGVLNQSSNTLSIGEHLLLITTRDEAENTASTSASLIVNATPELSQISLYPENPTTEDDIDAIVAQSYDENGDAIVLSYRWYRNGSLQEGFNGATLESSHTSKDDMWTVKVIPRRSIRPRHQCLSIYPDSQYLYRNGFHIPFRRNLFEQHSILQLGWQ